MSHDISIILKYYNYIVQNLLKVINPNFKIMLTMIVRMIYLHPKNMSSIL